MIKAHFSAQVKRGRRTQTTGRVPPWRSCSASSFNLRWKVCPNHESLPTSSNQDLTWTKLTFLNSILPNFIKTNQKPLWNIVKSKDGRTISLFNQSDQPIPKHLCASLFNDTFTLSFNISTISNLPSYPGAHYISMDSAIADSYDIGKTIHNLKRSLSCCTDGINSTFLQKLNMYLLLLCIAFFLDHFMTGKCHNTGKQARRLRFTSLVTCITHVTISK